MSNTFLTPRLLSAVGVAHRAHATMIRKGDGKPYIVHPIAVFGLLVHWGADEDTCIAGLLHDVLEDVPASEKDGYRTEIEQTFGPKVLEIVEGVTEQDKSLPWKQRKKLYLEHLKVASKESLLVSCADRAHNTSSLVEAYEKEGEKIWQRFNAPKWWSVWFLDEAAAILRERLDEKYSIELDVHRRDLNALLSKPLSEADYNILSEVPEDEKMLFIMDPLYTELRNHCMLTEQEMEDGMLEDTKKALEDRGTTRTSDALSQ